MKNRNSTIQMMQTLIAFALTQLVTFYCISVLIEAICNEDTYQVVLCATGSGVVAAISVYLFVRAMKLYRQSENEMKNS